MTNRTETLARSLFASAKLEMRIALRRRAWATRTARVAGTDSLVKDAHHSARLHVTNARNLLTVALARRASPPWSAGPLGPAPNPGAAAGTRTTAHPPRRVLPGHPPPGTTGGASLGHHGTRWAPPILFYMGGPTPRPATPARARGLAPGQLRHKIGVQFGSPETTTGGNALKYFASVRLDIRRIATVRDGDRATANRTRVKVAKNKCAPPFAEAEFEITFGQGIDRDAEILDAAVERGVISKNGSWFSHGTTRIGQGRAAAIEWLRGHPKERDEMLARELAVPALAVVRPAAAA